MYQQIISRMQTFYKPIITKEHCNNRLIKSISNKINRLDKVNNEYEKLTIENEL